MGTNAYNLLVYVLIFLVYVLSCIGFGATVLRFVLRWKAQPPLNISTLIQLASLFLLGQIILADIWTIIGLLGIFTKLLVSIFVIIGFGLNIWLIRTLYIDLFYQTRRIFTEISSQSIFWRVIILMITLMVCIYGVFSYLPIVESDPTTFYLIYPKFMASAGDLRILPGYYESFTMLGLFGELHYSALILIANDQIAKIFTFATSMALALLLAGIARRVGLGFRGQWITLATLFSSTAFTWLMSDGKVDLYAASYGLAAVFWVLVSKDSNKSNEKAILSLVGIFCGTAIIAKGSFVFTLFPIIIGLYLWQNVSFSKNIRSDNKYRSLIISLFYIGMWMAIAVIPNILKNSLLFESPLGPVVISPMVTDNLMNRGSTPNILNDLQLLRYLSLYPFSLVFGKYLLQYGNLSPLFIIFLPLIFFLPRSTFSKQNLLLQITILALLGIVIYTIIFPKVFLLRYFFIPILLLIIITSYAAEYFSLSKNLLIIKPAIDAAIVLILIITAGGEIKLYSEFYPNPIPYLIGKITACEYSDQFIGGKPCQVSEVINHDASPGDRVYNMAYDSMYWLRPDLLQCMMRGEESVSEKFISDHRGADEEWYIDTPQKWTFLYDRGFRYIFMAAYWKQYLVLDSLPTWLKVEEIAKGGNFSAYRMIAMEGRQPSWECRLSPPTLWNVVPVSPDKEAP